MKKTMILLAAFSVLACTSSFAAFSWQMYDFGVGPFDRNNNWSPISYPWSIGNLPSPGNLGEGGEKFDLEGLHFARKGSTFHVAIVNSFGYTAHSTGWNQDYRLGDVFFGFNGAKTQYAIDVSEGKLYEVGSKGTAYKAIPYKPGTYSGTGISGQIGAWEITGGTLLGNVVNKLSSWQGLETNPLQGNGDTYVWEFAFDIGQLGGLPSARTITFHNTLECGNDLMEKSYEVVPEPATMLLVGLGLMGVGALRKKAN